MAVSVASAHNTFIKLKVIKILIRPLIIFKLSTMRSTFQDYEIEMLFAIVKPGILYSSIILLYLTFR